MKLVMKINIFIISLLILCQVNIMADPIALRSPSGAPLKGAIVKITKLDGSSYVVNIPEDGKIKVSEVPLGILEVVILSWKNVPINSEYIVTPKNSTIVCERIGKLIIIVKGALGQGLGRATVMIIWNGKIIEKGITLEDGSYVTELPASEYLIKVSYAGKEKEVKTIVEGGKVNKTSITLDIMITLLGIALSSYEVALIVIGIILLIIAIYIAFYEYHLWRRRRLIKVLVPTKT